MSIWFSETNGCISNCYLLRTSSHCPLNKTHQENSLLSSFFLHPKKKQLVFLLVCPHDFTVVARSWTGVRCSWGLFFWVALTFEALDIMIFNRTRAGNSLRMGSLLFFLSLLLSILDMLPWKFCFEDVAGQGLSFGMACFYPVEA